MKKLVLLSFIFSLVAATIFAAAPKDFETYWEKACDVKAAADDTRSMGVWAGGNILATICRTAPQKISLFNATSGQKNVAVEELKLTGDVYTIRTGSLDLLDGDFTTDGKFIACSLGAYGTLPSEVYIWDTLTTGPRLIYSTTFAVTGRFGDACDVYGSTADNSAVIVIGGNATTAKFVKLTTADNGRTWTSTMSTATSRAQDIQIMSDGTFWAVSPGENFGVLPAVTSGFKHFDAAMNEIVADRITYDGLVYRAGAFAIDEATGLMYTMGYKYAGTGLDANYLAVFDMATKTRIATSTDALDANTFASATMNGSCAVEIVKTPGGGTFIYALSERSGVARYSYSTKITVGNGGVYPDYTTIQGAINSICAGAVNTTGTLPIIIEVNSAAGPYEEIMTLNDTVIGNGNIFGDVVIKGTDPVNMVNVRLQRGLGGTDDGLMIHQNNAGVIFKNIVFTPSLLGTRVTDDMLKCDENSANPNINWLEWWNCIFTDINAAGTPFTMTKAGALVPPPARAAGGMADTADTFLKCWNDAGESFSIVLDGCTFYGMAGYGSNLMLNGIGGEQLYFNNTLHSYSQLFYGTRIDSSNAPTKYFRVSGTDAGQGPLNCSAFINNAGHGVYLTGGASGTGADGVAKFDNVIVYTTAPATARGISGSGWIDTQIKDSIINVPNACVVDGITNYDINPAIYERVTFHNSTANNAIFVASGTKTLTLKDCIFSGLGTKISGGTAIINASNCSFVQSGTYAITAIGTTASNVASISNSPAYVSLDPTSASFMDVGSISYAGKATAGANLAGGADYDPQALPIIGLRNAGDTADLVSPIVLPVMTIGDATTFTLLLKNIGSADLTIASVVQASGTPTITLSDDSGEALLAAGATRQLDIYLDAAAIGSFTGLVNVTSNEANEPGSVKAINFSLTVQDVSSVKDWELITK